MCTNTQYLFLICFVCCVNLCLSRDQRYNPNSDFLLHEAGGLSSNNKNTYEANFPSLQPSKSSVNSNINSGKRDYVAPQGLSTKPTSVTPSKPVTNSHLTSEITTIASQPKRDYVAPQFPTLKPIGTTLKVESTTKPSSKRDYVAPQFPTLKPIGTTPKVGTTPVPANLPKRDYVAPKPDDAKHTPGKVKDLINFYDGKPQGGSGPSYSSILQGSKGNQVPSTVPTPKPVTLSSIVSGSNKPSSGLPSSVTRPPTPTKPGVPNNSQLSNSRPGSPTLPSSIVHSQGQNVNSNSPSDAELQTVSEELLRKDVNNAAKYVTVNYQEKTSAASKDDKAPLPLLTIGPEVWSIPTVQKFVPLLDNYERDTLVNEHVTAQERTEENAFMDAIMATSVIRHLMNFLKDKGFVTPDPKQQRDFLKQLWFGLYSRGKGKISSSGFEHIFVSELKNSEVSGLHNWVYFSKEEAANRANYLGYLKKVELSDKGAVIKMHFNQQGTDKPVGTMFIGTSPELEIALYTLCYVTRLDNDCNLKLGTKDVNILTHNYRYRSKNYIGSAYPQI